MHKQPCWLHIDINSYFASILQQENPRLRGIPLGVIKDVGRTCLIATSREAKSKGIGTGMRLADAKARYPQLVVLPAAFSLYLSATSAFEATLRSFSPDVEMFSLDEAFMYYTPLARHYTGPESLATQIQAALQKKLGEWMTCSIGIAQTKFLAKLAGEVAGVGVINHCTEDRKDVLLSQAAFKDVCGVGFRLEKKLKALGITSLYAVRLIPLESLATQCGMFWAQELKKMAYGEETHFLSKRPTKPHMQSVGRSITCMGGPWNTDSKVKSVLYNLTLDVCDKARTLGLAGRRIHISLRGSTQYWKYDTTFASPHVHARDLSALVWDAVLQHWDERFPVIRCHVSLGLLKPAHFSQLSFFDEWQKNERLDSVVSAINKKYGRYTIRPALLLARSELLKPEVNGFFGDKDFYSAVSDSAAKKSSEYSRK